MNRSQGDDPEYNFYKPRDTRTTIDSTHIETETRTRLLGKANGNDTTSDHDYDFADQEQKPNEQGKPETLVRGGRTTLQFSDNDGLKETTS